MGGAGGGSPPSFAGPTAYHMRYHTLWRQFFFITIAVSGRRAILSRLDGCDSAASKYPTLLPAGEAVHAALRALHGTWPELTLSNYAIMPDHVHFLLIIDPSRSITGTPPTPLFAAHRMMDEAERRFGAQIFERKCYLELSFSSEQLRTIRRYIRLNPARAIWKARNPDMFVCRRGVKTALLTKMGGSWDAIGDITLLGSPFLMHVRLTMKKTAIEHKEAIDEIISKAQRGMIAVSGFISPGEREALRRLKATPGARFIKVLPYALPHRYDPSSEDSRELAAHRMLIISDVPLRQDSQIGAHRAACLAMNDRISAMCKAAAGAATALCAMLAAAFTPLPDADYLEPSIQNEVDHALARAYSAREKGQGPRAKGEGAGGEGDISPTSTNNSSFVAHNSSFSTNSTFFILHSTLSKTDLAIRLVSLQKADGRWYDGTNDVTSAVINILERMQDDE